MEIKQFYQNHRKTIHRLILLGVLLPFLFVLTLFLLVRFQVVTDLPTFEDIRSIDNPESSELYAEDDVLIAKYFVENRTNITAKDLNENFVKALLATEDVRFMQHSGIDYRSLMRVLVKTILLQKSSSGGGSTLTQQVVKNVFPRKRHRFLSGPINKLKEMITAKKMEKVYGKQEILLLYANTVSFGERAFGLETAAKRFFNKPSKDLALEEAATLVGMLKATSYYSPRNHPERAAGRRNVVLSQMVKYGYLTEEEKEEVAVKEVVLDYQPSIKKNEFARYFRNQIEKEFNQWAEDKTKDDGTPYDLYRDGLKIYSSLDLDLQLAAEKSMGKHMDQLQEQFDKSWSSGGMFGKDTKIIDEYLKRHPLWKRLKAEGLSNKEILEFFTSPSERNFWTWDGYEKRKGTRIDSIKHYLGLLHTAVLAVDPSTGFIKTWVGGNDYGKFQYDHIKERRQVGSTFKPIVYLSALEKGIDHCKKYPNELRTYTSYKDWTPKNADGKYGGELTMMEALMGSVNTVSVQVLFEAGIPEVVNQAKKMGIEGPLAEVPSIVLGTSDVSLYEMVNAYSCLASGGFKPDITGIRRIENREGKILYEARPHIEREQVAEPEAIDKLNKILHQVNLSGTGRRLYNTHSISKPISGKTGTTQNQSDGWYIGYTPDLVVGAWVGTEDRRVHFRNLRTGAGSNTALPLVGSLFEFADFKGSIGENTFAEAEILSSCDTKELDEELMEMLNDILRTKETREWPGQKERASRKSTRLKNVKKERSKLMNALDKLKKKRGKSRNRG